MADTYPPVPEPGVPLVEQTICRKIIGGPGGDRCGGDMVRVGMSQEWKRDLASISPCRKRWRPMGSPLHAAAPEPEYTAPSAQSVEQR